MQLTLAQINEQNRTLWLERNKLSDEQMKSRVVLEIAINRVRKEKILISSIQSVSPSWRIRL
jgi:hypothetical protein